MLLQPPPEPFGSCAAPLLPSGASSGREFSHRMGRHSIYESTNVLQMGANITAMLGFVTILRQMLPRQYFDRLLAWFDPLLSKFNRYAYYKVPEIVGHHPNELYDNVQVHLSATTAEKATRASLVRSKGQAKTSYIVSASNGWIKEEFEGEPVWWKSSVQHPMPGRSDINRPDLAEPRRSFQLKIHKTSKDKMLDNYLDHVTRSSETARHAARERQLFTNSAKHPWSARKWSSIAFQHPSTFHTLALDPGQKKEIVDDLEGFVKAEDFYKRVGRAWKRGYLLYGPPGTGKSSMIAAMANFLEYDIYDLELTSVKDNAELRQLLLQTTSKSIIVIEDIDCTIELTNRCKKTTEKTESEKKADDKEKDKEKEKGGVTLSGLLNFTDGIWSCCGSEKIIIFTTNHIDKLDPALLRTGRMDMKIHLSYCGFSAFKVLASNYLNIQDHDLFAKIEEAFEGAHMTPADVTEYLINSKCVETALQRLIAGLEKNKLLPLPAVGTSAPETSSAEEVKPSAEQVEETEQQVGQASKASLGADEHPKVEVRKDDEKKEEQGKASEPSQADGG